jgi:hypothetical protein
MQGVPVKAKKMDDFLSYKFIVEKAHLFLFSFIIQMHGLNAVGVPNLKQDIFF